MQGKFTSCHPEIGYFHGESYPKLNNAYWRIYALVQQVTVALDND